MELTLVSAVQVGMRKSVDAPSPAATKTMRSLGIEADKEACKQVSCRLRCRTEVP